MASDNSSVGAYAGSTSHLNQPHTGLRQVEEELCGNTLDQPLTGLRQVEEELCGNPLDQPHTGLRQVEGNTELWHEV